MLHITLTYSERNNARPIPLTALYIASCEHSVHFIVHAEIASTIERSWLHGSCVVNRLTSCGYIEQNEKQIRKIAERGHNSWGWKV